MWYQMKLHGLHVQVIRQSWNFVTVSIYSLGEDYEIGRDDIGFKGVDSIYQNDHWNVMDGQLTLSSSGQKDFA